ncbi:hypothetical protein ABGB12_17820 [Actinocorallia sp. B10E7]|uniref:hypothetical protein n=1 Tax=Actinocorallia TaxID=58108 RepID=UPI0031DCEB68
MNKKHLKWAGGILAALYVINQPGAAADLINRMASGLGDAAGAVATFVNTLGS